MPVKALPKPFAYVSGVWLNGEAFVKTIWDPRPASDVAGEDWFDDVASITSFEYTNTDPATNWYILPPNTWSKKSGGAMKTPMERAAFSPLKGNIHYEDWELKAFYEIDKLKENRMSHTLDSNGDTIIKFSDGWHKDPRSLYKG